MASILERYGIKEVADLTFYEIQADGSPGLPVLYLDSLKVSTIEQSAESTYAEGGKGNPRLIGWDFGKEISLSIEDALFSPKSLSIMLGDGTVNTNVDTIKKTLLAVKANGALPTTWVDNRGDTRLIPNLAADNSDDGTIVTSENGKRLLNAEITALSNGDRVFMTFDVNVVGSVIDVSADSYPGTYYITGDTFVRNQTTGLDEYFQFIVAKGKVTSENTITLEADGDPTVFNMTVEVLKPDSGNMLQLVKYALTEDGISGNLDPLAVVSIPGNTSGYTSVYVNPMLGLGNSYMHLVDDVVTLPLLNAEVAAPWTAWTYGAEIEAEPGKKIGIVEVDSSGKALKGGIAVANPED